MRLINADKIDFGKVFIGDSDFAKDTREAAQNLIDSQPAAYDADKVVKKIADYYDLIPGWALKEIIEIVKSGGIESGFRGGKEK